MATSRRRRRLNRRTQAEVPAVEEAPFGSNGSGTLEYELSLRDGLIFGRLDAERESARKEVEILDLKIQVLEWKLRSELLALGQKREEAASLLNSKQNAYEAFVGTLAGKLGLGQGEVLSKLAAQQDPVQ